MSKNIIDRKQQRHGYKQKILCLRCKDVDAVIKTKIPIRLSIFDISYTGLGAICEQRLNAGSTITFNLINEFGAREMNFEVLSVQPKNAEFSCDLKFINLTYDDVLFIDKTIKNL